MRPKETSHEYIPTACVDCVIQVSVFPPIHLGEARSDRGWVALSRLESHCNDVHSFRSRMRRAWKSFRGCPDTNLYFETTEELQATIMAMQKAGILAFSEEQLRKHNYKHNKEEQQ